MNTSNTGQRKPAANSSKPKTKAKRPSTGPWYLYKSPSPSAANSSKPKAQPKAKPKAKPEAKPKAQPKAQPKAKPKAKPTSTGQWYLYKSPSKPSKPAANSSTSTGTKTKRK